MTLQMTVREMAKEEGAEVFVICAQIEQELSELSDEEKQEYLDDLGVSSSGLDKLVAASYSLLGLISFLTAGEDECRAWTIKKGTKVPQAAGKIHTDFELYQGRSCQLQGSDGARFSCSGQRKRACWYGRKRICGTGRRCDPVPLQCIG